MDIPCRTCGAPAGMPCFYVFSQPYLYNNMPGYHSDRKYVDFPAAKAAVEALTDEH
jgi:hypothetical protein